MIAFRSIKRRENYRNIQKVQKQIEDAPMVNKKIQLTN